MKMSNYKVENLVNKTFITRLSENKISYNEMENFLLYLYHEININFEKYLFKYKDLEKTKNEIELYFYSKKQNKPIIEINNLRNFILKFCNNIQAETIPPIKLFKEDFIQITIVGIVVWLLLMGMSSYILTQDNSDTGVVLMLFVLIVMIPVIIWLNKLAESAINRLGPKFKKELDENINLNKDKLDELLYGKKTSEQNNVQTTNKKTNNLSNEERQNTKQKQYYNEINLNNKNNIIAEIIFNVQNDTAKDLSKEKILKFLLYYYYTIDNEIKTFTNNYKNMEKYRGCIEEVFFKEAKNSQNNHIKHILPLIKELLNETKLYNLPELEYIEDNSLEAIVLQAKLELDKKIAQHKIEKINESKTNKQIALYKEPSLKESTRIYDLYNSKNYETLVEVCSKMIKKYPKYIMLDDIYTYRGLAYKKLNKIEKAFKDFSTAITLYSFDNSTAYLERGKIYLAREQYDESLKDINKAIECNGGNNGDDFYYRALLYIKLKYFSEAVKDLQKASKLCVNSEYKSKIKQLLENMPVETNKENVSLFVHVYESTEGSATRYLLNSNSYKIPFDYEIIDGFIISADYEKAIDFLNPILQNNAKDIPALLLRATVWLNIGRYDDAQTDLIKAKKNESRIEKQEIIQRALASIKKLKKQNTKVSKTSAKKSCHKESKSLLTNQNSEINLQTCSKKEILTLDGFTENKAKKFIKERNNGQMWYDIDSFVKEFEIQPHEMIAIQDRIIFPAKPKNKYGRRIDI